MTRPPMVLGLTLCEDVVVDGATQNISVIRAFTGFALDAFPGIAPPFCAFATLTAGQGDAAFTLTIERFRDQADLEPAHRVQGTIRFLDPLQTVYWVVRLSQCWFPEPGEYLFTLWIDGEWMAHRRLRVHP